MNNSSDIVKLTHDKTLVNSILVATNVLTCLSEGIDRLSDIADRLSLKKPTLHRVLKTLEVAGLVVVINC